MNNTGNLGQAVGETLSWVVFVELCNLPQPIIPMCSRSNSNGSAGSAFETKLHSPLPLSSTRKHLIGSKS